MNDQDQQLATTIEDDRADARGVAPGRVPVTARLMPRPVFVMRFADGTVSADAATAVERAGGSGRPLPAPVRDRFESSLGHDLSGVRVHTGGDSAHAATAIGARAYTVGQDIHFADGQYRPEDPFGLHLIAHEVVHTVQQTGGAARRALQPSLEVSRPTDAFELEAEALAPHVARGEPVSVGGVSTGLARQVMRADDGRGPDTAGVKGKFTVAKVPIAENVKFGPVTGAASYSLEVGFESVKRDAPADGQASTTAKYGGTDPRTAPPSTSTRSGAAGDAGKGAVGVSAEIKHELEQGVTSKMLGVKANFKGATELTSKGGKLNGSFNLDTAVGPVPLTIKVVEFNIFKWDPGKTPPFQAAVVTTGAEAQIAEFQHTASDGQVYTLKPTLKMEIEFTPDYAQLGKLVLENIAKIFATEVGLASSIIAAGALTIGAALYQIANSGEITERTEGAVKKCRTYCRAYEAAIKGGKAAGGDGAAEGTAAGKAWVAARQFIGPDSDAAIAEAARSADLYQAAWKEAWPKIRAKAIADYWADHSFEHLMYGDEGAGNGGFRTFKRVLDAAGGT